MFDVNAGLGAIGRKKKPLQEHSECQWQGWEQSGLSQIILFVLFTN